MIFRDDLSSQNHKAMEGSTYWVGKEGRKERTVQIGLVASLPVEAMALRHLDARKRGLTHYLEHLDVQPHFVHELLHTSGHVVLVL